MLGESGVPGGVLGDIFVSCTVDSFAVESCCFLLSVLDKRAQCLSRTQLWPGSGGVLGVFGVDVDVDVAVAMPAVSALPPFSFRDCKIENNYA